MVRTEAAAPITKGSAAVSHDHYRFGSPREERRDPADRRAWQLSDSQFPIDQTEHAQRLVESRSKKPREINYPAGSSSET